MIFQDGQFISEQEKGPRSGALVVLIAFKLEHADRSGRRWSVFAPEMGAQQQPQQEGTR
jgi:hypothetical protein